MSQGSKILTTIILIGIFFFVLEYLHLPSVRISLNGWGKTIENNFYRRSQQSLEEIRQDETWRTALHFCQREVTKIFSSSLHHGK